VIVIVPTTRNQSDFMRVMYWMWQQRESIHTVLWFKYEDFAVPAEVLKR